MMLRMNTALEYPQRHAVSAQEYLRMGDAGGYRTSFTASGGERVSARALPESALALSALFPA